MSPIPEPRKTIGSLTFSITHAHTFSVCPMAALRVESLALFLNRDAETKEGGE